MTEEILADHSMHEGRGHQPTATNLENEMGESRPAPDLTPYDSATWQRLWVRKADGRMPHFAIGLADCNRRRRYCVGTDVFLSVMTLIGAGSDASETEATTESQVAVASTDGVGFEPTVRY